MLGFLRAVLSRLRHQQVQPGEQVLGLDEVDVCEVVRSVRHQAWKERRARSLEMFVRTRCRRTFW